MHKYYIAVVFLFFSFNNLTFANDPNSGFRLADVTPKSAFTLHAENVVRSGKSIDLDIVRSTANPNTYKEVNTKVNACFAKAPIEQPAAVRYQNLNYPKPPVGFENGGVIGWVTAVNYGTNPGYVLVRKMAVYEVDPNGKRYLVTDKITCPACDLDNRVWGYEMPKMLWSDPSAWNRPNHGSVFEVLSGNIIKIPTSSPSQSSLFHFWNTTWPRKPVKAGWRYELEGEVIPVGAGMIMFGIDYWTATNGGTNVEAANSPWACAKNGSNWQIIRAGGFR
jgi:hypothetical protein